jgi:hypothetical protein
MVRQTMQPLHLAGQLLNRIHAGRVVGARVRRVLAELRNRCGIE